MSCWLSVICPSNKPHLLDQWLDSLFYNCTDPKGIELSLVLEHDLNERHKDRWGSVIVKHVEPKQYNINQLQELGYYQSTSPFVMLSGDDTICRSFSWDAIFKSHINKYPDKVVLVYPNDLIFGDKLACYPVVSREIMDSGVLPVPYERYAIDDSIFDIVPKERRIYLGHVIFEHMHLRDEGPGVAIQRDGKTLWYPIDQEIMAREKPLFQSLQPKRDEIRKKLMLKANIEIKDHKVLIGIPTAEMARRSDFYDYFNMLDKPNGTGITFAHGQSPAHNRNLIIEEALKNNFTHILFIDDDTAFKPDLLTRLLGHDKDVVSGLYLMRNYPHRPIVFSYADAEGKCATLYPNGKQGLVPIVASGLGCCLIRTDIFRKMEKPWIRLGELQSDQWCDDIGFFRRMREAGFTEIFCDLDCPVGHMAQLTVWPSKQGNDWTVAYDTHGEGIVQFPAHKEETRGEVVRYFPQ